MIRTMIVEDERITRRYLMSLIPKINHAFQIVASGENGADALRQIENIPVDLIVTDIRMPYMDGLELSEQIHNKYPHMMIILLSGFGEFEYARRAIQHGAMGYLLKPIVTNELQELLKQAERQWERRQKQLQSEDTNRKLQKRAGNILISDYIRACALGREYEIAYCQTQMKQNGISQQLFPLLYLKLSIPESDEMQISRKMEKLLPAITSEEIMNREGWVFTDDQNGIVLSFSAEGLGDLKDWVKQCFNKLQSFCPRDFHEGNLSGFLVRSRQELELADDWCQAAAILHGMRSTYITELGEVDSRDEAGKIYILSKEKAAEVMELYKTAVRMKGAVKEGDSIAGEIYMERLYQCFQDIFPQISVEEYVQYITRYLFFSEKIAIDMRQSDQKASLRASVDAFVRIYADNKRNMEKNKVVMQALKYIRKNYCEYISLKIVAEKAGVSASYLSNIFHKYMGESYSNYLTRLRMESAAEMLRTKQDMRLTDIAEQVGYVNFRHFLKVFKNYYGMTPTEYKMGNKRL